MIYYMRLFTTTIIIASSIRPRRQAVRLRNLQVTKINNYTKVLLLIIMTYTLTTTTTTTKLSFVRGYSNSQKLATFQMNSKRSLTFTTIKSNNKVNPIQQQEIRSLCSRYGKATKLYRHWIPIRSYVRPLYSSSSSSIDLQINNTSTESSPSSDSSSANNDTTINEKIQHHIGILTNSISNNNNNDDVMTNYNNYNSLEAEPKNTNKNRRKKKDDIPMHYPLPTSTDFPEWAYEEREYFRFEIIHESTKSQARVGRIHTPHGVIDTPGFVAVATNAALKGVDYRDADSAGQQLIFSNTYHLMIHPGPDIIEQAGGIHRWTNRMHSPFITDSGGFQVFSLAYGSVHEELSSGGELKRANNSAKKGTKKGEYTTNSMGSDAVKVTEEGVLFRSYRDGSQFLLTPESTVQAQKKIGADIIIPLDELPGYYTDRAKLVESVARTHRWEARSLHEHLKNINHQAMYCVIHGGIDKELRTESINYLTSLPFDGYAIGGSLGNGKQELKELLHWMMPMMDEPLSRKTKPRHLLGIADEESIRNAVTYGIDTLDSCYPTRLGRHGTVLTRQGNIRLRSGTHKLSFGKKIDDQCTCSTCQHYDRSYLWHLFKANEPIAITLATIHNIHYMNDLMRQLRSDIMNDII